MSSDSFDYEPDEELAADETPGFPSWRLIISLYGVGALVSLLLAFNPSLSSHQATNCLIISWVLALSALSMSILFEAQPADELD
ncbi:MAG: hypothetical protein KDD69_17525 [Bdellovibrionales bacterium]|nr:hypothetical protein [Bdellovibrionales bacterium]